MWDCLIEFLQNDLLLLIYIVWGVRHLGSPEFNGSSTVCHIIPEPITDLDWWRCNEYDLYTQLHAIHCNNLWKDIVPPCSFYGLENKDTIMLANRHKFCYDVDNY